MTNGGEVSIGDLRHHGGQVLDQVARGESLTVTKDRTAIAELRPLRRRSRKARELIARARRLPAVDPALLRQDVDSVIDQSHEPCQGHPRDADGWSVCRSEEYFGRL